MDNLNNMRNMCRAQVIGTTFSQQKPCLAPFIPQVSPIEASFLHSQKSGQPERQIPGSAAPIGYHWVVNASRMDVTFPLDPMPF